MMCVCVCVYVKTSKNSSFCIPRIKADAALDIIFIKIDSRIGILWRFKFLEKCL